MNRQDAVRFRYVKYMHVCVTRVERVKERERGGGEREGERGTREREGLGDRQSKCRGIEREKTSVRER